MAVEGVSWPVAPRIGNRGTASPAGSFIVPAATVESPPAGVASTEPVGLASVLTLQELGGETVQDREAKRHGFDMLAMLTALQRDLLGAGDSPETLQRLADMVAAVPRATDRRLAALMSAIIVRVRVELARRQV